uniref:Uncharacterized protein n=1 Tax=Anas platyrhynchos platyrhynchos TaxID=8840 RepID=A0A493U1E0_ANAPP
DEGCSTEKHNTGCTPLLPTPRSMPTPSRGAPTVRCSDQGSLCLPTTSHCAPKPEGPRTTSSPDEEGAEDEDHQPHDARGIPPRCQRLGKEALKLFWKPQHITAQAKSAPP